MIHAPHKSPQYNTSAFNCPHCGAYANQTFGDVYFASNAIPKHTVAKCAHCHEFSIWKSGVMVYPELMLGIKPNTDLPDDIKADFEEALSIIAKSPRGAAALLRLCIQKLCAYLGEPGKDINKDIASLVKKGLNPHIQQSLDIVRVIGNEAVHPGAIDLNDNADIAIHLFKLVNIIANAMITQPKEIEALYSTLPAGKLKGIEERDSKP